MRTIVAFDFDGTLTDRDTFVGFIRFCRGPWALFFGFARFFPVLVGMKMGLYPNWKAKQRVFSYFFRGMTAERFDACCRDFCDKRLPAMLRPGLLRRIDDYTRQGYELCIVSASVDRWIRPWAEKAGFAALLCTEAEIVNGVLTGRFTTPNCYGAEKVKRLLSRYPDREAYRLVAYGDSRGDRELLGLADEPHYREK